MSQYTYSVAADTANGAVNVNSLIEEITTAALANFDYIIVSGDTLDIFFTVELTSGEETTLDGVVAAHTGEKRREHKIIELRITGPNARRLLIQGELITGDLPLDYADDVIEIAET